MRLSLILPVAAAVCLVALPAAAQMRTSAPSSSMGITTMNEKPLALGLMGGYSPLGLPQIGLAMDVAGLGPFNIHTAPRMTVGPTQDFMIPLTLRPNEIISVPSLYFGIGPFASFAGGAAAGGALLELGVRTPVYGPIELEAGVEGGYTLLPTQTPLLNFTVGLLIRP